MTGDRRSVGVTTVIQLVWLPVHVIAAFRKLRNQKDMHLKVCK